MRSLRSLLKFTPLLAVVGIIATLSCKPETSSLPPKSNSRFTQIKDWPYGKSAYAHTEKILKYGPRPIESGAHKNVQAYISSELTKAGWIVTKQEFETQTPYGMRSFTNIVARYNVAKQGEKAKTNSPEILLAAHYDSKMIDGFLGADDAASCVGALLEMAHYLPKQTDSIAPMIELVFFDGEEALKKNLVPGVDGIYGSTFYSKYLNRDLASEKKTYQKRPKFGVLLDMIGHKNLSISIPSDTPHSLLISYMDIAAKHRLEKTFKVANHRITDDHVPMNEIAKVPTIDIIGDFNRTSWWHTTNDSFDIISEDSLATSIKFALELILDTSETIR